MIRGFKNVAACRGKAKFDKNNDLDPPTLKKKPNNTELLKNHSPNSQSNFCSFYWVTEDSMKALNPRSKAVLNCRI